MTARVIKARTHEPGGETPISQSRRDVGMREDHAIALELVVHHGDGVADREVVSSGVRIVTHGWQGRNRIVIHDMHAGGSGCAGLPDGCHLRGWRNPPGQEHGHRSVASSRRRLLHPAFPTAVIGLDRDRVADNLGGVNPAGKRTTPLTDFRREILAFLKLRGEVTVQEVADHFGITHEGARRQFLQLEQEGWVERHARRDHPRGAGRPTFGYRLTSAGDHVFPKHYDMLSLELIEAVLRTSGVEALRRLLAAIADRQVAKWEAQLRGASLEERLERLKGLYFEGDPYMTVRSAGREIRLIENNCPFLNVAMRQPALCSLTVGTLQRLLGVRVVREERFQDGHRRCVFRVLRDKPVPRDAPFTFEGETAAAGERGVPGDG